MAVIDRYLYTNTDYMREPKAVTINTTTGFVISVNGTPANTPLEDYGDYYLSTSPVSDAFERWASKVWKGLES